MLKQKSYNFTKNTLKAFFGAYVSSLHECLCDQQDSYSCPKATWKTDNAKVCSSRSAIFVRFLLDTDTGGMPHSVGGAVGMTMS